MSLVPHIYATNSKDAMMALDMFTHKIAGKRIDAPSRLEDYLKFWFSSVKE
jgi:hypothetical protein